MSRANAAGRRLVRDDEGSFPVVEAILVAVIVITAIIFFTSVQRPTTGADQGGLDLAQVSADTLQVLRVKPFTVASQTQTFEGWVTNVTKGDAATAAEVDSFIRQVLPGGARYSLRLDNGVSTLEILPPAASGQPRNARSAEIAFLPNWATYRNASASSAIPTLVPGQVLAATDAGYSLLNPATASYCYQAPYGAATLSPASGARRALTVTATSGSPTITAASGSFTSADLGRLVSGTNLPGGAVILSFTSTTATLSASATASGSLTATVSDSWSHHWRATPGAFAFKTLAGQAPLDLPLGKWRIYDSAACTGTPTYVNVVAPGTRVVQLTTTSTQTAVTVPATSPGKLTPSDVGLAVSGTGIPNGARLTAVGSGTATLSSAATADGTATVVLGPDPTYTPYGLHLVVWFGA